MSGEGEFLLPFLCVSSCNRTSLPRVVTLSNTFIYLSIKFEIFIVAHYDDKHYSFRELFNWKMKNLHFHSNI